MEVTNEKWLNSNSCRAPIFYKENSPTAEYTKTAEERP